MIDKLKNELNKNKYYLKQLINTYFSFSDLPKYNHLIAGGGNVKCPFHDNRNSPSAKVYLDEDKDILCLWCFTEKRKFYFYDALINENINPIDYLFKYKEHSEILQDYNLLLRNISKQEELLTERKKTYVDNLFEEVDNNISEYIEKLYTGES